MERQTLTFNRANPVTVAVERVADPTFASSTTVLKTLCPNGDVVVPHWTTGHEPRHWNLWNREALAYETRLVDAFSGSALRGPRLVDRSEGTDGSIQLCLEDISGVSGMALSAEDHRRFNAKLGQAQGQLIRNGHDQEPGWAAIPWLSRRWLRQYATTRLPDDSIYADEHAWDHPVVREGFGDDRQELRQRFADLYSRASDMFDLLERLPQTLCHLDFWPNNVIVGQDGSDVLIDWSFVGSGALGEDPGNWVLDTFFDHFVEPHEFQTWSAAICDAYLSGLLATDTGESESSFGGRPLGDLARLGMFASAAKYIWLPGMMVARADIQGPTAYGGLDGYPLVEVFQRRALIFEHVLGWIDNAKMLASELELI